MTSSVKISYLHPLSKRINSILSQGLDDLMRIENDEFQNSSYKSNTSDSLNELTDCSDDDGDEKITKLDKKIYDDDMSIMWALYPQGVGFWDIMHSIRTEKFEPTSDRISEKYSKEELSEKLGCNMLKHDYELDRSNDSKAIKKLHKLGFRLGHLATYYPPLDWSFLEKIKKDEVEKRNKLAELSEKNLQKFTESINEQGLQPWFMKKDSKGKINNQIEEFVCQNIDINCIFNEYNMENQYNIGWDGFYRLNVAKSKLFNRLYYSIQFSKAITKDDNTHPLWKIYSQSCDYEKKILESNIEFGEVVEDNKLTRSLFEALASPNEQLIGENSHVPCSRYRQSIISNLNDIAS
jgi:hypothetical protein